MASPSKRVALPLVMALAALALGSITSMTIPAVAQESPAGDAKTLTIGTPQNLIAANPFKAYSYADYEMLLLNYDMLYRFSSDDLTPIDGLGYWPPKLSDDGKTYTIKIREGVKWSDGTPLTAKDVAFTYNFVANNEGMGAFNNYLPVGSTFVAPDDTTLVWTMKEPSAIGPTTPPYIPILPEHIWARYDGKDAETIKGVSNVPSVGSGPFALTEWKEGEFWRVEANPNHWGPKPYIDGVVFRTYRDQESLKLALLAGEVDLATGLVPSAFNQLKNQPNIETLVGSPGVFDDLAFNFEGTANPALLDERVRDAIHHSIDKQAIVDRVLLGNGSAGDSVVLPMFSRWYKEFNGTPEEVIYDPQKADELLDEAGFTDSDGDGTREQDGQPFSLEILAVSDEPNSVAEAELISGFLKDIGIHSKVKAVSESKAYDLWGAQDFDMYVWSWDEDPDPNFITSLFTTEQCLSWSDGCYSNAEYDKLYDASVTEMDEEKRAELVDQMQTHIYDKAPLISLANVSILQAWRTDKWQGYVNQPEPSGNVVFSWGSDSYLALRPVTSAAPDSSGIPTWVWILVGVVIVGGIGVAMSRRAKGADEQAE